MTLLPKTLPIVALIGVVGLGATTFAHDAATPKAAVACGVNVVSESGGLRVIATAKASVDALAEYDLMIRHSGRGQSATIRQGGEVNLRAGQIETLGEARLSGRASDLDAEMTLVVEGQRYLCDGSTKLVDL